MSVITATDLAKRYRVWTQSRPTNLKERIRLALSPSGGASEKPWQDIWALRGVSFDVEPGEVFGVIGPNGAGKSTLLALLARITEPTSGEARIHGRVSSLLEVGTGFHPELSGRDNVFLNGAILGMTRAETQRKYDEIVDFSGVRDFIDVPVKRYSTGMYVRLAFSVAAHLDPEVLLLDEVLAVGDRAFQEKCLARIDEMTQSGRTVLFVSHDVASVARLCRRAVVIRSGKIEFLGDVDEAVNHYLGTRQTVIGGGPLKDVEREGNGRLRFASVRISGADGEAAVHPDQPLDVTVSFNAPEPVPADHVEVVVTIASAAAVPLATLSTKFEADNPLEGATIETGTTLTCRIDELPLKAGHYRLSLSAHRLGEVYDRVANQIEFTVHPADFFGSGILPSEHEHPLLVRHHWQLESAVAEGRR
jgi:homopolymeric O-antigen transport system ATP-binding protein